MSDDVTLTLPDIFVHRYDIDASSMSFEGKKSTAGLAEVEVAAAPVIVEFMLDVVLSTGVRSPVYRGRRALMSSVLSAKVQQMVVKLASLRGPGAHLALKRGDLALHLGLFAPFFIRTRLTRAQRPRPLPYGVMIRGVRRGTCLRGGLLRGCGDRRPPVGVHHRPYTSWKYLYRSRWGVTWRIQGDKGADTGPIPRIRP